MSESKEKKRRYNEKLALIAAYEHWVTTEPPKWKFISHRKWQKRRPRIEMVRESLRYIPGYLLREFKYYLDKGGEWDD